MSFVEFKFFGRCRSGIFLFNYISVNAAALYAFIFLPCGIKRITAAIANAPSAFASRKIAKRPSFQIRISKTTSYAALTHFVVLVISNLKWHQSEFHMIFLAFYEAPKILLRKLLKQFRNTRVHKLQKPFIGFVECIDNMRINIDLPNVLPVYK